MYSNCCCSCSFEAEIIKISQSSHKMYSNNILKFQESTILNARTKKSGNFFKASRIYIYIFTNLLSTSIHGYQEKRKKKHQYLEIIISRITARVKKKKITGQKKEKANFVNPVEKYQEICNQLVKSKRKPTIKFCNATITESAQYKVEPITKIKSPDSRFNFCIYICVCVCVCTFLYLYAYRYI